MANPSHNLCAQGRTWFLFQGGAGHAKMSPPILLPSLQPCCSQQPQPAALLFIGCLWVGAGVVAAISTALALPAFTLLSTGPGWQKQALPIAPCAAPMLSLQQPECWGEQDSHSKAQRGTTTEYVLATTATASRQQQLQERRMKCQPQSVCAASLSM